MRAVAIAAAALVLGLTPAGADTLAEVGALVIADGEARSAGPMARTGAGYLTLSNDGREDDRLLAAQSPAAERVELHTTLQEDGVARMVELEAGITVPAGGSVTLEQGAMHLMFMGLTDAWDPDGGIPVTLVFEQAGPVDVTLPVAAGPMQHDAGH